VARERRRAVLPRLITAARKRRAELRIERERQAAEPLEAERTKAHEKMQRAEAKKLRADEKLLAARSEWSSAHLLLAKIGGGQGR
jgi:hypothetical protein